MSQQFRHSLIVFVFFPTFLFGLSAFPNPLVAQTDAEKIDALVETIESQIVKAPQQTDDVFLATGERKKFLMDLSRSLEDRVNAVVGKLGDVKINSDAGATLKESIDFHNNSLVGYLEQEENLDRTRAQKVIDLCKSLETK